MITVKQGEDIVLDVVIYDENNNKVTLSTATKLRMSLTVRGIEAFKYADKTLEPLLITDGDLVINTLDATRVNVLITREQSKLFPLGELSGTILIETPDTVLTNKRDEYTYILGTIVKGVMKNETLN